MQREHAYREGWSARFAGTLARVPNAWRGPLIHVALAWTALLVAFRDDWHAMARQWWDISTYNHILLVPAIVAWLIWERASQLAALRPSAWWPGLLVVGGAVVLWVLGDFAGIATARQLGAVLVLAASALALLGPKAGAGLAFPLFYMLFLVPVGDELVPALQMITAAITIALVHLSGVSAVIDGVFISTQAGLFEVAEACSGVKFLVAMIAFGVLVANLCFLSWLRRVLFLLVCTVVPVLANGIRAWGTIFAAQFVGADAAAGFDHIIYGWIFFAVIVVLVLGLSWRFFDRPAADAQVDVGRIEASPLLSRLEGMCLRPAVALGTLAGIVLAAQAWAHVAERLAAPLPSQVFLPEVAGWQRVDYQPHVWWEPRASGADHRLLGRYSDGRGRVVDVFVAVYSGQGEGREAGGFGEGALRPGGKWAWLSPGSAIENARSDRLLAEGRVARLALTWYRSGDMLTGSNARLKLAAMRDRLLLRSRPTVLLILSAEEREGVPAEQAIASFRRAQGPLAGWMDRMAAVR